MGEQIVTRRTARHSGIGLNVVASDHPLWMGAASLSRAAQRYRPHPETKGHVMPLCSVRHVLQTLGRIQEGCSIGQRMSLRAMR